MGVSNSGYQKATKSKAYSGLRRVGAETGEGEGEA